MSLASAGTSSAEPSSGEVQIVLVGSLGRESTLPARIRSWFDPRKFHVSVRTSEALDVQGVLGPSIDPATHVWVTTPTPDRARFYFARTFEKESIKVYLTRELRLEHGLDELAAERIAQVCFLSTVALVEGQAETRKADVEESLRAEPAATTPAASTPRETSAGDREPAVVAGDAAAPPTSLGNPKATDDDPRISASDAKDSHRRKRRAVNPSIVSGWLGYGASLRGDEGIGHGPRGRVAVRFPSFGIVSIVQTHLPASSKLQRLDLHLYGASFVAGLEVRHDIDRFAMTLHVGPGFDIVHYEPEPADPAVRAGASGTEVRPLVGVGTSVEFGPAFPRFSVVAELGIPFTRTHYDLVEASKRDVVGRAWYVVPTFGAELGF